MLRSLLALRPSRPVSTVQLLLSSPSIRTRSTLSSTSHFSSNAESTLSDDAPSKPVTANKVSWLDSLLETYAPHREARQILLGERLFRAAQDQAYQREWYSPGVIPLSFRARHAMLTMHVWFLHKRLILDPTNPTFSLRVQEELFDFFWNDTKARIRGQKLHEMTIYSHLRQVQQYTMLHMTHYDHALSLPDPQDRLEECMKVIYIHVLGQDPKVPDPVLHRLGVYVEYQLENIVYRLPDEYFFQGRIGWGNLPEGRMISQDKETTGFHSKEDEEEFHAYYNLPDHWRRVWTDAGESYYWNTKTNETQWTRPVESR